MRDLTYLQEYYNGYDEQNRLSSRHGQVEYITTMKYIHNVLHADAKILEIGAGTGRYSLALAHEGYRVDAIELVRHNLDILTENIRPGDNISAILGDALDLSMYADETFDVTLLLGPMYHLYTEEEKIRALGEALRVTKKNGSVLVSYCMNEGSLIMHCFQGGNIRRCMEADMLTEDYHCVSQAKDVFELVRTEDIERLNRNFRIERQKLVATDGATNYMRSCIDAMDDETFSIYLDYHLSVCERQDLIGASHHTLDILKKL